MNAKQVPLGPARAAGYDNMTGSKATIEIRTGQFVFYTHFCIQSANIGLSELSLPLLPFLDMDSWAYSTIHELRRLVVKARASPEPPYTAPSS